MGYSIGIRTRSPKLRYKLLAFMKAHYRSWPLLLTGQDGPCYAGPPTDDLDYDSRSKTAIGVNYGVCGDWEREWAFTIVRWMALRAGTNRRMFSDGVRLEAPVPFMVYDGYESWPLIVVTKAQAKKLPKRLQGFAVDQQGIHNGPDAESEYVKHSLFGVDVPNDATQKATAKVGSYPDKGDRHAWRVRFNMALLEEPAIRKSVDKGISIIRDELTRLDALWNEFRPPLPIARARKSKAR